MAIPVCFNIGFYHSTFLSGYGVFFCPHFRRFQPHKIKVFKSEIRYALMSIFNTTENGFKMRTFWMFDNFKKIIEKYTLLCYYYKNKSRGGEEMRIAICDDNAADLAAEYDILRSVLNEKGMQYDADMFTSSQELLNSVYPYDIIFLDVEMDGLNGIQAAEKLRSNNADCLIFFVTNHEAYLDDAFNQHAFRFWTKPIDKRKLAYGIESALKEMENNKQFITVTVSGNPVSQKNVLIKNILYVYMENKRQHIVTVKGDFITKDTYKNIYEQLKRYKNFCEPCRGYCVNFDYITNYTHDTIICKYKKTVYKLDISRRKYDSFHKSFIDWISDK